MSANLSSQLNDSKQAQMINNGLKLADKFINRNYLINVTDNEVVSLSEDDKNVSSIRLYQIEKLVYDKEENINDKLISVYSSLFNVKSSALLIICGNAKQVNMYLGIRSKENASVAGLILEKSFIGNYFFFHNFKAVSIY